VNREQVTLSIENFFAPKSASREVAMLLRQCIAVGLALDVAVAAGGVRLASVLATDADACRVQGQWRSKYLRSAPATTGALLLAPLLFWITNVRFPPSAITTLGGDSRTVADLVMRLYYVAALRRQAFQFIDETPPPIASTIEVSRELARTYLQIAKANIQDDLLRTSGAMEHVLAEAHLPLAGLTHPVLRSGAGSMQTAVDSSANASGAAQQRQRLLQLRGQWIATLHR
jgi:hypothetical protein